MTIVQTLHETTLNVTVDGRLDMVTAPEFEQALQGSLEGIREVILDFEKLDYISSSGLRALLILRQRLPEEAVVRVVNANSIVRGVFELTGFDHVLTVQ